MRKIGRAVSELVGVLSAGFIAFFVMLGLERRDTNERRHRSSGVT
jgi:hypothetical protein